MVKPSRSFCKRVLARVAVLIFTCLAGHHALAQVPAPLPSTTKIPPTPGQSPAQAESPGAKAWRILREGLKEGSADKRAQAVRALGLLPANPEAEKAAVLALKDEKSNVRLAAVVALGSMHAEQATAPLKETLKDSEPAVVLAAANSLLLLRDDAGYDVYYAVLTGERRASKGLVQGELDTLKDKKKMAQMGLEEGIGFIPFGGIGYEIFKTVTKDDSSPLRAAAAKKLAHDPKPDTVEALVKAAGDKNWKVRAAALDAIALRGDPSLISRVTSALDDEKDIVRFTAAACIAHLSGLPQKTNAPNAAKP
jgi:HEAT repeat protein